jgi:outer membrane protein OmpA-like peptidoglycan-associated protein
MKAKKISVIVFMLVCVFGMKAQYVNTLTVDEQYPGDEKAKTIYDYALQKQGDKKSISPRVTWIANRFRDNWFISLGGGVGQLMSEETRYMNLKDQLAPTGQIAVGKWFSPVWGIRLNITGAQLKGFATWTPEGYGLGDWYVGKNFSNPTGNPTNTYIHAYDPDPAVREFIYDRFLKGGKYLTTDKGEGYQFDLFYGAASIDFLINLKNLFLPYNYKGFFNPVLYGGAGYAHTFKKAEKDDEAIGGRTSVNSLMEKIGLQLNFRLDNRWQLFLDGQALILPENFDRRVGDNVTVDIVGNYTLGLTYSFNFRPFIKAPLINQLEIDALNNELNELRNRPAVICPPVVICPEPEVVKERFSLTPVFFTLDSYVVRDNQYVSIAKAAAYLIENSSSKLQIAAYADKNTGNPAHNLKLSQNRANSVATILIEKFGIDKSRLDITYFGDKVQPFAENDWNRVALFIRP